MDVFHLSGKTPTRNDRLMNSHDLVASFFIYLATSSFATGLKLLSSGASLLVGCYKGLSFKASLILFIFSIIRKFVRKILI